MSKLAEILKQSWVNGAKTEVLDTLRGLQSPSFIEEVEHDILLGLYEDHGAQEAINFMNHLEGRSL